MHFLLTTLKVVYVLTTPMPELMEDSTVEAIRIRAKWENDDYIYRGHILNGMSDSLFDVYMNVESAKELWDSLESKRFVFGPTWQSLRRIEESLRAQDRFGYYNNGMFMLNLNKVPDDSDSVYMSSSTVVNSTLWHAQSRDAIFDENRFSSIPRPKDIIPNLEESQRDDHSDDVPSETPEPRRGIRRRSLVSQYSYCYSIEEDPRTYNEAVQSRDAAFWKEAIDDEIGSIMENNTWVLSDLPPGCKPLGFRQKEGIDYFDTYAPVARITTIRLLLALAAIHNLVIHQMWIVKTTFLNGDLDEEVYMKAPKDLLCLKILKKFNREDCSPVSTPMDPVEKLKPNTGKPVDQLEYSRAIGCLMYAMTSTRPDIAYAVALQEAWNTSFRGASTMDWRATWLTTGDDEVELTNEEFSDPDNENLIDKDEVAEIFRIETDIFDFDTPICKAFNEFNYLLKIDTDLLTRELPWMVRVGYMTYFQDYEWYHDLVNGKLKNEALKQNTIYEGSWGDATQGVINFCTWLKRCFGNLHKAYANTNIDVNYNPYLDVSRTFNNHSIGNLNNYLVRDNVSYHANDAEYEEDRCELLGNPRQELPVCKIGRFELIKYSFGPAKKYISIKECEHDDFQRTEDDACHAYQEIFRIIDEGWFETRATLDKAYPISMDTAY
ncbi:zinc finger, CCHC-type containing protein [Tanacetum coccineum]